MKTTITAIALALGTMGVAHADASEPTPSEPKKVCVKVYDAKLKKDVEKCKKMKLHKKHEGTAVPAK
jgi:hypothetical protein